MTEKNAQTVTIHLATEVRQEGDKSDFVYDIEGQLVQIGGAIYLRYQEPASDSQAAVPVTIKIGAEGEVRLTRNAENRLQLNLAENRRLTARYHTQYGMMQMDTETTGMRYAYQDDPVSGDLALGYRLWSGKTLLGEYQIKLHFNA